MHGILAYENYARIIAIFCGEIVTLLLALVALFYAVQDYRSRVATLIAPAVIWVVVVTALSGYQYIIDSLHKPSPDYNAGYEFMASCIFLAGLPLVMSLIVVLVLWFKSR
jgi:hypothetical protein